MREDLEGALSCLDFSCICSLFPVTNDKSILHQDSIQKQKIKILLEFSLKEVINDIYDATKVIFKFSSNELSDVEKSVLCKGLYFSVKPKPIEYSDFLLPFELLFRDVKQENCSEDLSLIKSILPETAFSLYESFSSDISPSENYTTSEFKALRHFSKKNIVIHKSDKVTPSSHR